MPTENVEISFVKTPILTTKMDAFVNQKEQETKTRMRKQVALKITREYRTVHEKCLTTTVC